MFGVDRFSAIVDPDQTAILAVGAVSERVSAAAGEVRIGPWVELTLTVDHRVVDGVLAARFLAAIRARLERRYAGSPAAGRPRARSRRRGRSRGSPSSVAR